MGDSFAAIAGRDYIDVSTVVVFPAGSTLGAMKCIEIPIVNDDLIEGPEYLSISTVLLTIGTAVTFRDHRLRIWDDESKCSCLAMAMYVGKCNVAIK